MSNIVLIKTVWFILGIFLAVIFYFFGIGIYTRVSIDPVIFLASLVIAFIVAIICCILIKTIKKLLFDKFTLFVMGVVYFLIIVIIAIFGPTFIDRSISYHIAFFAAEKNIIYVDNIVKEFSTDIFNKRIHDAVKTGFLTINENGSMSPTFKAKVMYYILKPLGELTGSMETYNNMKKEVLGNDKFENKN